jgi:hypothetical protein
MSEPLCSNKLLEDTKRAIAAAKQTRDKGEKLRNDARTLGKSSRETEKAKAKS